MMDPTAAETRARLRMLLEGPELHLVPGVANVLDARIAERCGFEALFVTGAGIANSMFGYPDIGLVTMTETVEAARRIAHGVAIPVIADADTGYGNHLNVMRTVSELEAAGAAAIVLEDQVSPKRCGHFEGKQVVSADEMVTKLIAAREARCDPGLVIVARTDAIAVEGLEGALERANAYREAGADVIFVEAPSTHEEIAAIPRVVDAPCLINLVEEGATPILPAAELEALGFKFALYANLALRVGASAVERAFALLRDHGTSAGSVGQMMSWEDRQETAGLGYWRQLEARVLGVPTGGGVDGV